MSCPRTATCPMFAVFRLKSSLGVWKAHYCEGNFERCERFQQARCGTEVPANLLPNGKELNVSGVG